MAFRAGWETEWHGRVGKNLTFSSPDEKGHMREVQMNPTKSSTWEAATGNFILCEMTGEGTKTHKHYWAYQLVEVNTVCWRVGVASAGFSDDLSHFDEFFPVHDLWSWWEKLNIGDAPPWSVCVAGGKDKVVAVPTSVIKAGNLELDPVNSRPPTKLKKEKRSRFLDGVGRLRLQEWPSEVAALEIPPADPESACHHCNPPKLIVNDSDCCFSEITWMGCVRRRVT
jgi:hypothetical protein